MSADVGEKSLVSCKTKRVEELLLSARLHVKRTEMERLGAAAAEGRAVLQDILFSLHLPIYYFSSNEHPGRPVFSILLL